MNNIEHNTLLSYPVFRIIDKTIVWKNKSLPIKTLIISGVIVILIICGAYLDKSIILEGDNIGLIEHPVIWALIILQCLLPFYLKEAVSLLNNFLKSNENIALGFDLSRYRRVFENSISRKTNISRFIYTLFVTIGFISFAWNSYQNQLPEKFLGFDFWDSINHPFGYWITRLYKAYTWILFFPACLHIQFSIVVTSFKVLKSVQKQKSFILKPYHQDRYGGGGEIIKVVIKPFIPVLILASISTLGVFFIHQKLGITPIASLFGLSILFIITYLLPAFQLNSLIKSEKKTKLIEISQKQDEIYSSIIDAKDSIQISQKVELLDSLKSVSQQIKSISNWPHLGLFIKLITLTNITTVISIAKSITPFISNVLK